VSDTYEVDVKIKADSSDAESAFGRLGDGLESWGISLDKMYEEGASIFSKFGVNIDQFASKLGTSGGSMAAAVGIALAAFEGLKDVINETTAEYAEDETAQLKFNAAMTASAKITDEDAEALSELAEKTGLLTGNTTASVQSQIAMLAATGRSREEIEKMMTAAEGLSNATGVDLNTALTQINATFSGTAGRLTKMTPELKDLTKEQLEQGAAVDVLNKKYGEFSDALGGSTAVSIANQKNQWNELKGVLGEFFESGLKPIRDMFTSIVEYLVKNKQIVIGVIEGIGAAVAVVIGLFNPILGGIALVVTAIFSLQNAVGGWKMLWLETEKVALLVVKAIMDVVSGMDNAVIAGINAVLTAYNKVATAVGGKPIKLLDSVDVATATGIVSALKSVDAQIDETTAANKKLAEAHKKTGDSATESASDQKKAADLAIAWDKKVADDYVKNLETKESAEISMAQKKKATLEEVLAISKKYDDEELAHYKTQIGAQETEDKNKATATIKDKDALKKQIEVIEKYYADQITQYEDTQIDKRVKLETDYTKTLEDEAEKKATYEATWADKAATSAKTLSEKQKTYSKETLQNQLDAIDKQLAAELAKASTMGASDATLANIHKTYEAEKAQATQDSTDKQIASGKTLQDAFASYYKDMKEKSENWNNTFKSIANTITDELGSALKTMGEDIINGGDAWGDLGKAALEALSDILTSIGEQLAAMAVVKIVSYDYVDAGIAAAGSVAAFVASGVISGLASSYATGTDYSSGGYSLVGELGPETVYLPQGSKVANASETASGSGRASSGTSSKNVSFTINAGQNLSAAAIAREVKRTSKQMAFAGIL
jgi:hypothetical protein